MSTPLPRPLTHTPQGDWLQSTIVWGIVPGWVVSLVLHASLFVAMVTLTQLPSCRGDYSGEGGTGFREIGLRAREDGDGQEGGPGTAPGALGHGAEASPGPVEAVAVPQSEVPGQIAPPTTSNGPPIPLNLPDVGATPAVIGRGGPPPLSGFGGAIAATGSAHGSAASGVRGGGTPGSRGGGGVGGGRGTGSGQTSLFGVNDAGKKFVYVIDRSFSMEEHNAFRAAKAELLTSLSRLTEVQQFQVIFYNNEPLTLATRDGRSPMFLGTDAQRLQVSEQIGSISPDGGTRHMPAIQEALKYNPDVIFLLTDGAEPPLSRADLDLLKNRNRQGTRIHCIEFGTGPQATSADGQPVPNFLMKLAAQNSGQYTYRNVRQLGE